MWRIGGLWPAPEERNWIGVQFVDEGRSTRSTFNEVNCAHGTPGVITKQYVARMAEIEIFL